MPEEIEVETKELQDTIEELREERAERKSEAKRESWMQYVAITTALLAVFAAIGAMRSGALVNEAMVLQLKASDKWNEYQAARQKDHLYTLQANQLLDAGARPPAPKNEAPPPAARPARKSDHAAPTGHAPAATAEKKELRKWASEPADTRLSDYLKQVQKEQDKQADLKREAEELERESAHQMHLHHAFAQSVAFIQVAIALSAIGALTRRKAVWGMSLIVGLVGIYYFILGFITG